jgi:hypothetical protein
MHSSFIRRVGVRRRSFVVTRVWSMGASLLLASLFAVVVNAQSSSRPINAQTLDATRAELTHRLDSLQSVGADKGKKEDRSYRASEIAALKTRLANGDFDVGDRFIVDDGVRRDTVLVRDSVRIALQNWPDYSLHGTLRSELQPAIEKYVGTYVREPRIRVFPLTRLTFSGGFPRPGTFVVDPTRPLSDALAIAGGTAQGGRIDKITIYRGKQTIMPRKRVMQAIQSGETIEELGLQPGDELNTPVTRQGYHIPTYQIALFSVSVFSAILALIRSSYIP